MDLELVPSQGWEPSQVRIPVAPPWGSGREKVGGRAGIREPEGESWVLGGRLGAQSLCVSPGLGGGMKPPKLGKWRACPYP